MKKTIGSSAILLLTAFIWGLAFVAQTKGASYMDTFTFNASRFLLGAVSLLPVALLFEKDHPSREKKKKTFFGASMAGIVLFTASALQQYGAGITFNPGKAGFITGLYTVLTPIFYFVIFRRKTGIQTWIGAVFAVVGLYMLCFDGTFGFSFGLGEAVLLIGAFFWAGHIIVVDRFVDSVSPLKFACEQFFVCAALNLIFALIFEKPSFTDIWAGKWAVLYCGVFSVGVAYTCQIIGQKLCSDPSRAAILLSSESLFSLLGAIVWNALPFVTTKVENTLTAYGMIGCALIFIAIIMAQLPSEKNKKELSQ